MSELRAIKPISTAYEKTKKLLFEPFDAWLWLKLIIITIFVGNGGGNGNSFNPGNFLQYTTDRSGSSRLPELIHVLSDPTVIAIIIAIVLFIIALILLFAYLRAVFSFVLVESLTSGNVRIIQPFVDNMGRGFKVFLFNLLMTAVTLVGILIFIGVLLVSVYFMVATGSNSGPESMTSLIPFLLALGVLFLGVLAFLLFTVLIGIIVGFFYDFGIPLMYFKGMGLREAVGHLFGLVKREPVEFLAYMVLRWVLAFAIGMVFLIVYFCILGIFLVAGILLVAISAILYNISVWLLVPVALTFVLGLILLFLIVAFISLPIGVYFRYYSLDFLRSFDPSYVKYTGRFSGEPAGLIGQ